MVQVPIEGGWRGRVRVRKGDVAEYPGVEFTGLDDIVFVDVPLVSAHLVLNLEFAGCAAFRFAASLGSVVVQRVVHEDVPIAAASSIAMPALTGLGRITADGVAAGI